MTIPRDFGHISTTDVERYYLDAIIEPQEVAALEEHLEWCQECLDRLGAVEAFIDRVKAGRIQGYFEVEMLGREGQR